MIAVSASPTSKDMALPSSSMTHPPVLCRVSLLSDLFMDIMFPAPSAEFFEFKFALNLARIFLGVVINTFTAGTGKFYELCFFSRHIL